MSKTIDSGNHGKKVFLVDFDPKVDKSGKKVCERVLGICALRKYLKPTQTAFPGIYRLLV